MSVKVVRLYTDGSCNDKLRTGGWAYILIFENYEKLGSGYVEDTNNNYCEMIAIAEGLKKVKEPCKIKIYTDSLYAINLFHKLTSHSLKTTEDSEDRHEPILEAFKKHDISIFKVKAHSNDFYNDRCHKGANAARKVLEDNLGL